jgi:hypothetical protein
MHRVGAALLGRPAQCASSMSGKQHCRRAAGVYVGLHIAQWCVSV